MQSRKCGACWSLSGELEVDNIVKSSKCVTVHFLDMLSEHQHFWLVQINMHVREV
jgi:hypothetical protein